MSIPSVMADLSVTPVSNSPAGSESPTAGDDFLRAIQAILRTTNAKGADIASAATTDIGAATGEFVDVTGTTTITALGTVAAGIVRTVRFTGALTLTHNATSLQLPGSANITTANGDVFQFRSLGSGNWKCVGYLPVAAFAKAGANGDITSLTACTNITAAAVTVATDDKVMIQDTSDANKLKTVTAQSIADLAVITTNTISQLNTSVVVTDTGTDGKITKTVDGVVIGQETGAARLSTIDGGSALIPEFKCRAWVNFDASRNSSGGSDTNNTNRFIRASGNVASVLKNGTGDYTISFSTSMPDTDYVLNGLCSIGGVGGASYLRNVTLDESALSQLVGSSRIRTVRTEDGRVASDVSYCHVMFYR